MIVSLTAQDLACLRGERRIFQKLSFTLGKGEALVVEGANGAGKTSLLRLVAGFLPAAEGTVALDTGREVIRDGEERGRLVGWLGHQDGLKPQLRVEEQLDFFGRLYGAWGAQESALDRVGLWRQKSFPCRYLSAGQKKRLGLARLLVSGRPLWLLDEPFAALDRAGRVLSLELMSAHCRDGGILVAASHDPLGLEARTLRLGAA